MTLVRKKKKASFVQQEHEGSPCGNPGTVPPGVTLPFSNGNWDQRQAVTPVWEGRIARSSGFLRKAGLVDTMGEATNVC